jgi:hypothetical protein
VGEQHEPKTEPGSDQVLQPMRKRDPGRVEGSSLPILRRNPNNNMPGEALMVEIDFRVVARAKTETEKEGTIYKVRFKSSEGHRLILRSPDEAALYGFALGETITIEIKNPQKTLETSP